MEYAATMVVLFLLLLLRFILKKAKKRGLKDFKITYMIGLMLLVFADTYVVAIQSDFVWNNETANNELLLEITYILEIIGIFVQLFAVFFLILSRDDFREKEAITRKYLEAQTSHYDYLEHRERETKRFRHDLRGHIFALHSFTQNKQYEELEEHLETMYGIMETFGGAISVNNNVADAILNKYDTECAQQGVQLIVKGRFPENYNISSYDLCAIFSNLLSNALEAVLKTAEKQILVNIRHANNELNIRIENAYEGEILIEDGRIRTKKGNHEYHGMGLGNVTECVERNDGCMSIQAMNQRFIVNIELQPIGGFNENCSNR